jgi:tetratricopeptide (TPR) repeat protein
MIQGLLEERRHLTRIILLISLMGFLFSCHRGSREEEDHAKYVIDSLNSRYAGSEHIALKNIGLVNNLVALSDSIGYPKGMINSYLILYVVYFREEQYPEANEMLKKALELLDRTDNPFLAGRVYFYCGQFQEKINNDDVALNYYLKSADGFSKARDLGRMAKVYRQIGNISFDNEDWRLAYKYRWLAYNTQLQANDSIELIKDLNNLSIYYSKHGVQDSAKIFLDKALQINEKLKSPRDQGQFLINIASLAIQEKRYDYAEKMISQAMDVCDSIHNRSDFNYLAPYIYINLGLIEKNKGHYEKAGSFIEKAIALAGRNVTLSTQAGMTEELSRINLEMKKFSEASVLMQRYRLLTDSNNRELAKQNLMALEMKYKYEQAEKERIEKIKRQRLYLIITGIVIGLIIFILILLYSRQRIRIRNARLEKKIQDISLERLNRELASQALNMVRLNERKIELINALKQHLPSIKKDNQQIVQKVIAGFENDQNEASWKEFELRFKEVHSEFYDKLLAINPNLTLNEKRLCAFLRLDMTSKEISAITGQSQRAIEQARTRLRKQLNLTNQQISLSSFLSSL